MLKQTEFLCSTVQSIAVTGEAECQYPSAYRARFVIDFELKLDDATAMIRTARIVRNDEDFPA